MQNPDWDDLRVFLTVDRAGSLAGAARVLAVNHSTVLRRLNKLESDLAVRLFEHLPTGYTLTAAGEALRDRLRGVEDEIGAAQRQLAGLDTALTGVVRMTTTDTLARGLLIPRLAAFRAQHPGIELQLVVNNTFYRNGVDVEEGAAIFAESVAPLITHDIFVIDSTAKNKAVLEMRGSAHYECNLVQLLDGPQAPPNANTLVGDPAFCDAEHGDFHVHDLSPAILSPCGRIGALGKGCTAFHLVPSQ